MITTRIDWTGHINGDKGRVYLIGWDKSDEIDLDPAKNQYTITTDEGERIALAYDSQGRPKIRIMKTDIIISGNICNAIARRQYESGYITSAQLNRAMKRP
jgi:YD repeat-containing protein